MQEKRAGGHRCACRATVAEVNHPAETVDCEPAAAYLDKSAYHGPYHIAQKAVGGNLEITFGPHRHTPGVGGAHGSPPGMCDVADVGLYVGMQFGERCEILGLKQNSGGAVHGVEIDGGGSLPHQSRE